MKNNRNKSLLAYFLVSAAVIFGLVFLLNGVTRSPSEDVKYSKILEYFNDLEVSSFELDLGSGELSYTLKDDNTSKLRKGQYAHTYTVPSVSAFYNKLFNETYDYQQAYNEQNEDAPLEMDIIKASDNSFWLSLLPTVLLVGSMILMVVLMMRAQGGGKLGGFGKSNAKQHLSTGKKATFADVAGADEEKEELEEIVDFLKNPKKFDAIGARVPKGVLLMGPPGTGKTLLARAVAGEAGVPFFSISGSDFVEMFVGVGASRVRDLFGEAKKNAPAIIFIDEIDAVGRQRGAGLGGGHDEREQTLNQLLVEMDGFSGNEGIIVMAATNRRDILDPALLRPGRFDRQILVSYPDIKGREEILKVHSRNKPLAPDVDLKTIAKTTVGFTGADLENLINEASLLAARKNRRAITKEDLEEASIKVIAGPEKKSRVVTENEKRLTAYHEAGHAICTYYCPTQDKVHQVSIIPRGMAGGYTLSLPEKDKAYVSKKEMRENIIVLLGGRVAEKIILDDISTGASNDLERATSTARNMVTRYGFSDKLGPVVYGHDESQVFLGRDYAGGNRYSEAVAAEIDEEIKDLIEGCFDDAENILRGHIDKLHTVAKYLIAHEKIDADEFIALMEGTLSADSDDNAASAQDVSDTGADEQND